MKVYLYLTTENDVIGYSDAECPNTYPYEFFKENYPTFEEFSEKMNLYKLVNGQLILNETKMQEQQEQKRHQDLERLRAKRETLFKKYIDRSPMWYEELTEKQREELRAWREAWKELPERFMAGTWEEPELPKWLE